MCSSFLCCVVVLCVWGSRSPPLSRTSLQAERACFGMRVATTFDGSGGPEADDVKAVPLVSYDAAASKTVWFMLGAILRHDSRRLLMSARSAAASSPDESTTSGSVRQSQRERNRSARRKPVDALEGASQG